MDPKILDWNRPRIVSEGTNPNSFLQGRANPDSFNRFSGLSPRSIRWMNRRYSAAADVETNESLVVAADIMKSEMRGTISERNREPLNTP
jgi:hypothetical protein